MPSSRAANASPWAWLPALAATTPAARSASESCDSRLNAPRTLKEPVSWRFSALSTVRAPTRRDSSPAAITGVRRTRAPTRSRAALMSSMPRAVPTAGTQPPPRSRRARPWAEPPPRRPPVRAGRRRRRSARTQRSPPPSRRADRCRRLRHGSRSPGWCRPRGRRRPDSASSEWSAPPRRPRSARRWRGRAGSGRSRTAAARRWPRPASTGRRPRARHWFRRCDGCLSCGQSSYGGIMTNVANEQNTAGLLGGVSIFSGLTPEQLADLASVAVPRRWGAGEVIFREGDPGDTCYIVQRGTVRITRNHSDGRTITLAELREGEIFGDLAMFDSEVRSATVEAAEETTAVALLAGDMRRLLLRHPDISLKLLSAFADRLKEANERISRQSFQTVASRVAGVLLSHVEAGTVDEVEPRDVLVRSTRAEMAQLAGSSRESVSRFLATLERAGLVTCGRGKVVVHDPAALRRYIY